jgi:rhomboid protease GluP
MDWSLALASQGIESTIDHGESRTDWGLIVDPKDYTPAIKVLREYHLENRGWPWQQTWTWPAHFDRACVLWALWLAVVYYFSAINAKLIDAGVMNTTAVFRGEWWRLFTATQLHADIAHLATNLSLGIVLLGLVLGRFGSGLGLLATILTGAGGNMAFLLLHSASVRGLGASGMVMGALGLLAGQSFKWTRSKTTPRKHLFVGVAAGFMLFVLFGLAPESDIVVHIGGFISGLLLGVLLALVPARYLQSSRLNLCAGICFVALIALTWWLALR